MKKNKNTRPSRARGMPKLDARNLSGILRTIPGDDDVRELAETFAVLSDPTRLKIVLALRENELCVCDLSRALDLSPSAVSHQLRVLRTMRLVKFRREGKMAFYTLDDDHIVSLLNDASDHINEE